MTQDRKPLSTVVLIDARGLNCPLPVLRLRKRLHELAPGTEVELLTTDPAAQRDVPAFCEAQGHAVVGADTQDRATRFLIRKGITL